MGENYTKANVQWNKKIYWKRERKHELRTQSVDDKINSSTSD